MSKCITCKKVTTIDGIICDHCQAEFCPDCYWSHEEALDSKEQEFQNEQTRMQEL